MPTIDTPIAQWNFDGDLADSVGGRSFTAEGDPPSFSDGKLGSHSLELPASIANGFLLDSDDFNFVGNPFTVCFWTKSPHALNSTWRSQVAYSDYNTSDVTAWKAMLYSDALYVGVGGGSEDTDFDSYAMVPVLTGGYHAPMEEWIFCCLRYDGTDLVANVNDLPKATLAAVGSLASKPGGTLVVASSRDDSATHLVDQLYVYDYCLTDEEVGNLYGKTSPLARGVFDLADGFDQHGLFAFTFSGTGADPAFHGSGGATGDYLSVDSGTKGVSIVDTAFTERSNYGRSYSRSFLIRRNASTTDQLLACARFFSTFGYELVDESGVGLTFTGYDASATTYPVVTTALSTGSWHLVCCGIDLESNQVWISLDGAAKTTAAYTGPMPDVTEGVEMLSADDVADAVDYGQACYFDGVLSEADIAWLYGSGSFRTAAEIVERFVGGTGYLPTGGDGTASPAATFLDIDFPDLIELGSTMSRPGFDTVVVGTQGGRYEQRIARIVNPRRRFEVTIQYVDEEELSMLTAFFASVRGKLNSFRFRDWSDYALGGYVDGSGFHVDDPVPALVIDATHAQIRKKYTYGGQQVWRTITKPKVGTVTVYLDGELQTSGYSVDHLTGIITFDGSIEVGVVIAVACLFEVPCRLDTDEPEVALRSVRAGSVASLPLVEVAE